MCNILLDLVGIVGPVMHWINLAEDRKSGGLL
jgi:hypothetical protein